MNLVKRDYFPVAKDLNQFLDNFLKGQTDASFIDTGTWAPAVDIKNEWYEHIPSSLTRRGKTNYLLLPPKTLE